jgi:dihydrofolate reductase
VSHPLRVVLVVAVAENGVIGRNGKLPWRLKSEMAHFREVTMGKPVVMGRKTWDSLPRKPLPGRTNIIVSRDREFADAGAIVASSIAYALDAARGDALRRGVYEIAVIGGSHIFASTLPIADRIEFTRVHLQPEGDTFFPALDPGEWRELARRDVAAGADDEAGFTILTYGRQNAA